MESQREEYVAPLQPADSYNGARRENFTWSQSISDLDVIVNVPDCLTSSSYLRLSFESEGIKVEARECVLHDRQKDDVETRESPGEWAIIFQGQLSFPIKASQSIWTLVPGRYVHINLEKFKERWWNALIIGEEKINLEKIDCSKELHELDEPEQMKIRELMWKQRKPMVPRSH